MTPPVEMDCLSLVELVTDYLDGSLTPQERAAVDDHLAGCEGCGAYLEQMRTTIRLTGMLSEEQIPPEARRPLLDAFRAWRAER
jgi:predicted anti-sigma-YlaC factor YlaD